MRPRPYLKEVSYLVFSAFGCNFSNYVTHVVANTACYLTDIGPVNSSGMRNRLDDAKQKVKLRHAYFAMQQPVALSVVCASAVVHQF
jgi:hypothetical protein